MNRASLLLNRYRETSDPLRTERRIELAALILSVFLVLQLLYSTVRIFIISQPEAILPAADSLIVRELQHSGLVSTEQSNEVRARPVFWPSRRPVNGPEEVAGAETTKPGKNELDKVKLLGIFGAGDSAGIIALVKGNKKRILLGDKVVGWTLDAIERDQAVFVDGGQSQNLALEPAGVVADPVTPTASKTPTVTSEKLPNPNSGLRKS